MFKMNNHVFTFIIFMLASYIAQAQATIPEPVIEDDIALIHEMVELEQLKSDEDILQSLDNLDELEDNEIFIIEQHSSAELEVKTLVDDELLLDDGFDDLDIESILVDEELTELTSPQQLEIKDKQNTPLLDEKPSVGIQGEEEQLINSLDKSDLMDFKKVTDKWRDDVDEDIEIEQQY